MDEVKIDVDQVGFPVVTLGNKVVSPHLLCQSARRGLCHDETSPELGMVGEQAPISTV
jgi:hypothetical protein